MKEEQLFFLQKENERLKQQNESLIDMVNDLQEKNWNLNKSIESTSKEFEKNIFINN